MRFDAITLFPEMFDAVLDYGITRRALDRGLYRFRAWNPRDVTDDPHRTVDDRPYGGGPGMLMLAEPLDRTLNAIQQDLASEDLSPWVVHFSPRGRPLTHQRVMELRNAALNQSHALVEKLMFRVRAQIPPELIRKYVTHVKTGLPGVAYARLDPSIPWPAHLEVKLPQ